MVGPFMYINSDELDYRGWLAQLISEEKAQKYGDFLISDVSHSELFEMKFKITDVEYYDSPRGRVVYNTVTKSHIIYIDRCLEDRIDSIAFKYRLDNYEVMYDEHYVCPSCIKGSIWHL